MECPADTPWLLSPQNCCHESLLLGESTSRIFDFNRPPFHQHNRPLLHQSLRKPLCQFIATPDHQPISTPECQRTITPNHQPILVGNYYLYVGTVTFDCPPGGAAWLDTKKAPPAPPELPTDVAVDGTTGPGYWVSGIWS